MTEAGLFYVEEPDTAILTDKEKKQHYTEMFQGIPDAIFILSGRVRNIGSPEELEYTSTGYDYSDGFGMIAGIARVDAAAILNHYFPDVKFITTSHTPSSPYRSMQPIIDANVMAEELKRLGVSEDHIIREINSINTLTELQEMEKLIARYKWQRVGIITNEFHAERVSEMLNQLRELSNMQDKVLQESLEYAEKENPLVVVAKAEDILITVSSHYKHLIEHARTQPSYKKRLESERRGIEAIRNRTYRPTGETSQITSERTDKATKR